MTWHNTGTLNKGFAPAKPFKEISDAEAQALTLIIQRKRDGARHFLVIGDDVANIYTRRIENVSAHFPDVVQELCEHFLPGTILDAEYVIERDGHDDFSLVNSVCRSTPERGARLHRQYGGTFHVFDILYLAGVAAYESPYLHRFNIITSQLFTGLTHIRPVAAIPGSLTLAKHLTIQEGWEGLVLWDANATTAIRMNGSPIRANCYKWKPDLEDDFVATGFEFGTGSLCHVAGALTLAQYDSHNQLIPCGKVGTGLDLATRHAASHWSYPTVVQVRYSERTDDGKLRFPVFVRKRDDKIPMECIRG